MLALRIFIGQCDRRDELNSVAWAFRASWSFVVGVFFFIVGPQVVVVIIVDIVGARPANRSVEPEFLVVLVFEFIVLGALELVHVLAVGDDLAGMASGTMMGTPCVICRLGGGSAASACSSGSPVLTTSAVSARITAGMSWSFRSSRYCSASAWLRANTASTNSAYSSGLPMSFLSEGTVRLSLAHRASAVVCGRLVAVRWAPGKTSTATMFIILCYRPVNELSGNILVAIFAGFAPATTGRAAKSLLRRAWESDDKGHDPDRGGLVGSTRRKSVA